MQHVTIYTARFCPYCKAARSILEQAGIQFLEIDISGNWENRDEMIAKSNGQTHVPQVFFGERHIGGYSDLKHLNERGGIHQAHLESEQG